MTMTAERQCTTCGEMKTDFARGLKCRECHKQYCSERYYAKRGPLKVRTITPKAVLRARHKVTAYLRRYNITIERRDEMLAEQGGACAICRTTESPGRDWSTTTTTSAARTRGKVAASASGGLCASAVTPSSATPRTTSKHSVRPLNIWRSGRRGDE